MSLQLKSTKGKSKIKLDQGTILSLKKLGLREFHAGLKLRKRKFATSNRLSM